MMDINWIQIYKEIQPVYDALNSSLRSVMLVISIIIGTITFLIYRNAKKKGLLKNKLGFIHVVPILIFATFLIIGMKQSLSDPIAHTGKISKKWLAEPKQIPHIEINVIASHSFSAKGINKQRKDTLGIKHIRVTQEIYKSLPLGKRVTIITAVDNEGFAFIKKGKVTSPMPGYVLKK